MTWETADLEALNTAVRATKRSAGIEVEEPVRKRGYDLGNVVILPTLAIAWLVFFGLFGALMSVLAAGAIWLEWDEPRAWTIVIGIPIAISSRAAYIRFVKQLDRWHKLQWRTKELYVDPPKVLPTERQIEQTAPGHHVVLQAKWLGNWQRDLANRVHNNRGEWIGGDSLVRKILKDIVRDLNNKYSTVIKADLMRLGWITEDLRWTDKAREELRARVFRGGDK